jgi:uncharacterized membrane protein YfcA
MLDILQLVVGAIVGLFAGMMLGTIGGGGGGTYVILLTFVLGLPVTQAIGTTLAISAMTAFAGAIPRWRSSNICKQFLPYLCIPAVIGVMGGALLNQYMPTTLLKLMMAAVFVLLGLFSVTRTNRVGCGTKKRWVIKTGLILFGIIPGLLGGAFGMAEAVPTSAFLVAVIGLEPQMAVGTTLITVLAASLAGAVVYFGKQSINFVLVLALGIWSAVGAYMGARLTSKVNRKTLAIVLAILALVFGVFLAFHS